MGPWASKIPVELLAEGLDAVKIDDRIDTVIITGVTAAGCVRHTVEDAIAEGFRPIVVREAVGDRVAGTVAWNLFDIDSKFGDVEPLENVITYLNNLPKFSETTTP
jgi:maleamate amidohydrolase